MSPSAIIPDVSHAIVFLLAAAFLEHYTRRSRLPLACWMLAAGAGYGLVNRYWLPGLPVAPLAPGLIFFVMVPLLIFESAASLHPRTLFREAPTAGLFATAGMGMSTGIIGAGFALGLGFPWPDALLFASIVSATDPVAVNAVVGERPFPERLRTLVEGESLLNDGAVVIAYGILRDWVFGGSLGAPVAVAAGFLWGVGGAILLGAAVGFLGIRLLRRWRDARSDFDGILVILSAVYGAFWIGEHWLHVSGVIAVMAASLVLARSPGANRQDSASAEEAGDDFFHRFFRFAGRMVNIVLFFLLGLHIGRHEFLPYVWTVPFAVGLALASRAAVVYGLGGLVALTPHRFPLGWRHVLNLAGVRGALSIALILMLPADYAHREVFLCAGFVMILLNMLGNPLALGAYLDRASLE
jgi:CPA1 family monovalent cation:H+ antiporter